MNVPILRLGLRSLFGRSRAWLMIAMPILLLALVAALKATNSSMAADNAASLLELFGIGIVVPIVTLIATTTLINSEFDDGSIIYLLTKPISRLSIMASKAAVILGTSLVFAAVPVCLAGLIMVGGEAQVAVSALAGAVVASVAYVGIFTALATTMKRSVIGCLLYWLIWESTLSTLLGPVKWLSARAWGISCLRDLAAPIGLGSVPVPLWYAIVAAVVALAVGTALAAVRLASMTISEE